MTTTQREQPIPAELEAKADEIITHYPISKRSASLPLLHLVQEHFGYISDEHSTWIAAKLEVEPIHILEVLTFYPMLRRAPLGKHHIRVCRTLSCAMAGSYDLLNKFCDAVGITPHEAQSNGHSHVLKSPCGTFSVEFAECLASCGTGPVCMINDDFYESVDPANLNDLLDKYRENDRASGSPANQ